MRYQITEVDECVITVLETHKEKVMKALETDFPFYITHTGETIKDGYVSLRMYEQNSEGSFHDECTDLLSDLNIPFEHQQYIPHEIRTVHRFYTDRGFEYASYTVEAPAFTIDDVVNYKPDPQCHVHAKYLQIVQQREDAKLFDAEAQLKQWQLTQVDKLLQI